jgi:hypothetical protein
MQMRLYPSRHRGMWLGILSGLGLALLALTLMPFQLRAQPLTGRAQAPAPVVLRQGQTLVAYLGPTLPVEEALTNVADLVTAVWRFDAWNSGRPWSIWNADLPRNLRGFESLESGRAYVVTATQAANWRFDAAPADRKPPPLLVAGQNITVYLGLPGELETGDDGGPSMLARQGLILEGDHLRIRSIFRDDSSSSPDRPWSIWSADLPANRRDFNSLEFGRAYYVLVENRRPQAVTVVADSVLLGAKSALEAAFGELISVDAKVSRQFDQGTALLAGLRDSGRLGDFVVVHLGSNGILNDAMFDRMMLVLQDVPRVFFMTVRVPREWETRVNAVLRRGAAQRDRVSVIEWWAATQTRPEIFAADGFHIGPSGAQLVVDLLAAEF